MPAPELVQWDTSVHDWLEGRGRAARYHAASHSEKQKILDEFTEVTGFHRKHAIRALRKPSADESAIQQVQRSRIYKQAVVETLTIFWEAADRMCGKRLKVAIPALLEAMERHGHLNPDSDVRRLLLDMSSATIDRLLAPIRNVPLFPPLVT